MRILGICHDVFICSAAIVVDGVVQVAIPEERLDRSKQSRGFPVLAIRRCLQEAGLELSDFDEIAIGWNPAIEMETPPPGYLTTRRARVEHLFQVPSQLFQFLGTRADGPMTLSNTFVDCPPITFIDHYDAHIGAGFHLSPFDRSAVLVMDGRGEKQTCLLAMANGVEVERLEEVLFPHSLGLLYGAVTQYLGFRPDSDEWKVMALAAFAEGENPYREAFADLVRVADDGTFELDLEYFEFYNFHDARMFSDKFVRRFGPPRLRGEDLVAHHEQIAAATQAVFEEILTRILTRLHARTGVPQLSVSGGCFMNSVFNGKITAVTPFEEVFISSCPDDSGTSLGAALYLSALRTKDRVTDLPQHNFWGVSYTDEQCLETVRRYGLPNTRVVNDPGQSAADDLVAGRILGWFQGPMEFGQRALGGRSILLDPRRSDGKEVVNSAIKFREAFRPFAPAILAERVHEYFDCVPGTRVPYMEKVLRFRPEKASEVPAVVHVDGTGRLQTVDAGAAPRYHRMIECFAEATGVPLVLNTSFNLNGEPIVCSPEDAIRTFFTCGLDVLYLGNVRVAK
ncbi:MAG: carbamoyltransferase C-terminal domain-containing protein [Actinomycetota bacterium]